MKKFTTTSLFLYSLPVWACGQAAVERYPSHVYWILVLGVTATFSSAFAFAASPESTRIRRFAGGFLGALFGAILGTMLGALFAAPAMVGFNAYHFEMPPHSTYTWAALLAPVMSALCVFFALKTRDSKRWNDRSSRYYLCAAALFGASLVFAMSFLFVPTPIKIPGEQFFEVVF